MLIAPLAASPAPSDPLAQMGDMIIARPFTDVGSEFTKGCLEQATTELRQMEFLTAEESYDSLIAHPLNAALGVRPNKAVDLSTIWQNLSAMTAAHQAKKGPSFMARTAGFLAASMAVPSAILAVSGQFYLGLAAVGAFGVALMLNAEGFFGKPATDARLGAVCKTGEWAILIGAALVSIWGASQFFVSESHAPKVACIAGLLSFGKVKSIITARLAQSDRLGKIAELYQKILSSDVVPARLRALPARLRALFDSDPLRVVTEGHAQRFLAQARANARSLEIEVDILSMPIVNAGCRTGANESEIQLDLATLIRMNEKIVGLLNRLNAIPSAPQSHDRKDAESWCAEILEVVGEFHAFEEQSRGVCSQLSLKYGP